MRKLSAVFTGFMLILALALVGITPVGAANTTVTITHANMQGWAFEDETNPNPSGIASGGLVNGPAGGLGTGSAHFILSASTAGELVATSQFAGLALSTLTTLKFDTYTLSAGKTAGLGFDIDYDPTASCASLTIRPDCYQGRLNFIPALYSVIQPIQTGTWQTWDTMAAGAANWYGSRPPIGATQCIQSNPCTFATMIATYPNAKVMTRSGTGQFGVKAGSGYSSFDGNTDRIVVGTASNTTTFDFELGGATATLHVNPNGDDIVCNGSANVAVSNASFPNCAYKTINGALINALAGDTLLVHAGTYTEQVNITKSLTLTGDGAATTTIQAPGSLANDAFGNKTIVEFTGAVTDTMSGFTINGPGPTGCGSINEGIIVTAGANLTLSATTVSAIRDQPLSGCQNGESIRIGTTPNGAASTGTLTATGVTVVDFQKNGITFKGAGTTGSVTGSTITGAGATPAIAQNGIQISNGATATVTSNQISNFMCNHPSCGANPLSDTQDAAVLILGSGAGVVVQGNAITNSDIGIYSNGPGVQITGNTLTNNRYEGMLFDEGTATASGNSITGGNIGVEVVSYGGNSGNSQVTFNNNVVTGATVAGIQLQDDTTSDAFVPVITGSSNKISGNAAGVNNTTAGNTPPGTANLTKNWWGQPTGPTIAANPGGTGDSASSGVAFAPWCGNSACTIFYGVATKLVFTTQPAGTSANAPLTTQPVVQAQDADGNLGFNFSGPVALAFGTNPSAATLGGTNPVNAVHGVATFSGISVSVPGAGYTLTAFASGLTSATSSPFTVGLPVPTIVSLSISAGNVAGGTPVTITGTNFAAGDVVTFDGLQATNVQVLSSTQISVKTPAHPATGQIEVKVVNTEGHGSSLPIGFNYVNTPPPPPPSAGSDVANPFGSGPAPPPTGSGNHQTTPSGSPVVPPPTGHQPG